MVIKLTDTEKPASKRPTIQASKPRKDSRAANPCFVNQHPITSMAQDMKRSLIKVLICDDDSTGRELVRTYLQQLTGREIVLLEAGHVDEIQNALDKGRIDLVLMDSQLPGKSGMEWLLEISKRQLAPVVMLTGSGTDEITVRALQEGAIGYLPRNSLSQEKLGNIIDAALDKWTRLQQARADNEKLEKLATVDSLTGLYNRPAVLCRLRELISFANRYKEDFSLIMLDLDHFKNVNDRYGHLAGDEVLAEIAALARRNVRDTDIVGRYGGEEFIIILPKTALASSWVVAERLRSIVEKTEMKDSAGSVFSVTVSQGLAGWERGEDATSLISRADEALYKAKAKGRNRVQILLGPSLRDKV